MPSVTYTPTPHQVFNEFDHNGLLLGLIRLENERNPEYKRRLLDVMSKQANSTYQGLIHGITRELGLEVKKVLRILPVQPASAYQAIVFQDTKCIVYDDIKANSEALNIDRFDIDGGAYSINELIAAIDGTGLFTATLLDASLGEKRSMTIYNQTSLSEVVDEYIGFGGNVISLDHTGLIDETIAIRSSNLTERVTDPVLVVKEGRFYIDVNSGTIYSYISPEKNATIRYKYKNDNFVVSMSPVILHNIQSTSFKTKMFENGTGAPTALGATLLNELLSVHPSTWGL